MSDTVYEIEIRVRSAIDESLKRLEGPLQHQTANDVAVDLANILSTRSGNRMREILGPDR